VAVSSTHPVRNLRTGWVDEIFAYSQSSLGGFELRHAHCRLGDSRLVSLVDCLSRGRLLDKVLLMKKLSSPEAQLAYENYGSWLDFHRAIVQERLSLGLTQRALGKRLGISQPAVAQFEKATYTPTVDSILAYAQALGIRVNFGIVNS